ncbi:MAG: hypothetical protein HRT36_02700 [Alphaproteobacteria bacterium]|nr:hypothetical protein [Alphaproteobacteria bacterium]
MIAEAQQASQSEGFLERADMIVGMAEKYISKHLRTSHQQTQQTLTTDAEGLVSLPDDLVQIISISVDSFELQNIRLSRVLNGKAGYSMIGGNIRSFHKQTPHSLLYYAAIPNLSEAVSTNWLLKHEPELYYQAVLRQIAITDNNAEQAAIRSEYVATLFSDVMVADFKKRFTGLTVNIGAPA